MMLLFLFINRFFLSKQVIIFALLKNLFMVYIQSTSDRYRVHNFDAACAMFGTIESALTYRLTSFEEVQSGKFDSLIKRNLFVGSTEFMREVFKRIGLENVRLPENSNRISSIITLSEAHKIFAEGNRIFIKPLEIKLFTGLVLDGMRYSCLNGLPDDTKVLAYEPFEDAIESEWRIYVHNNKMVDARNYSGDFTIIPYWEYVKDIININKSNFPVSYTIDIGILSNKLKENVVIEYNDMWAIGNYGIPNDIYLRLLRDRYFEIVR